MLPAIPLIPIIFVASLLVVILVLVVVLVWMEMHRKRQPHLAMEAEPVAAAVTAPPSSLMTTPTPPAPPPTTLAVTPPPAGTALKQAANVTVEHAPLSCPHCHAPNKDDAFFCTQCGGALRSLTPTLGDTDATKPLPVLVEPAPPTSAIVASDATPQQSGATTPGKPLDRHDALNNALATAARPLSLAVGRLSDVGLVREINEDSLTTLELVQVYNSISATLHLYAVADGMGGHAAGEVASQLALKHLRQSLLAQESAATVPTGPLAMLKQAGQEAARAVHVEAQRTRSDMGTTLVAALVDSTQRKFYAINVGDSRLYKLDAAAIQQVTKDHSLVQRLLDSGQLTPAEARHHPNANLIYRTLGERANIEIDAFEQTLAPGETLLLCTDGLCGLVDDDELHRVVTTASAPQAACARLVELAKAAGGHDNITVIVVAVTAYN